MYAAAAPLNITPVPDVMTRVFMLFKGVEADDLSSWVASQRRAEEDVRYWRDVAQVDSEDRQKDVKLFRVLEWGGMEIK